MKTYTQFRPTAYDSHLPLPEGAKNQEAWLVAPAIRTRDSEPLEESNFQYVFDRLAEADTGRRADYETHRFGYWGPGWYEIILVRPGSECARVAAEIEARLASYPILDEEDFSRREDDEAERVWRECYSPRDRIAYIRRHPDQFSFESFAELLASVRGTFFGGVAQDLFNS